MMMSNNDYFFSINLLCFLISIYGSWRATIELPNSMKNQTCCNHNYCNFTEEDSGKVYESFNIYRFLYPPLFFINSLIPWNVIALNGINYESVICIIIVEIIYLIFISLFSFIIIVETSYVKCTNPETLPFILISQNFLYELIMIIFPIFTISILFLYYLGAWIYIYINKVRKNNFVRIIEV